MKKLTIILSIIILALSPTLASANLVYVGNSTPDHQAQRIYGQDRYQTATSVADQLATTLGIDYTAGQKFQAVVLASGNNWPDAISGTSLAKLNKAPILLLDSTVEALGSKETFTYMSNHVAPSAKIFILGGKGIMPEEFTQHLISMGYSASNIQQIGGVDRDETSFMIAKMTGSHELAVVSDQNFYDAISANPFYTLHDGAQCSTVLIPSTGIVSDEEKNYFNNCTKLITMGDLSNTVNLQSLYPNAKWIPFTSGTSEYSTNSLAAGNGFTSAFIATGEDYPDALTGMVLANFTGTLYGSPIILLKNDSIPQESLGTLNNILPTAKGNKVTSLIVLGGTGAISDNLVNSLLNIMASDPRNQILNFSFKGRPSIVCTIANGENTVSASVSSDTDVTALIPDITVENGVTISPKPGVPTDFTNPVKYTLTDKNGNVDTYTVIITKLQPEGTQNLITGFNFTNTNIQCQINNQTGIISAEVPYGTDLMTLIPQITVSPGATINPSSGIMTDFSHLVCYTVTSQNGLQRQYCVNITAQAYSGPSSSEKKITFFKFNDLNIQCEINDQTHSISGVVPYGTDLAHLVPDVHVSDGATVLPGSGIVQDFTRPVEYDVRAQDGSTQGYIVTITTAQQP